MQKDETVPVSVRLPRPLVGQLDKAAGKHRAAFLKRAIVNELNRTADHERYAHLSKQVTALTEKVGNIEEAIKAVLTLLQEGNK